METEQKQTKETKSGSPRSPSLSSLPSVQNPHPQLLLFADVLPNGNGGWTITSRKPVESVSPKHAAKFLEISRSGIYRLIDLGKLEFCRPTQRKILITVESLKKHKADSRDPEFWDKLKASAI